MVAGCTEGTRRLVSRPRDSRREGTVAIPVLKSVAFHLVDALIRAVERNVEDPDMRQRLAEEVMRLTGAVAQVKLVRKSLVKLAEVFSRHSWQR